MEEQIKILLSSFDWQYIISVNILTYVVIKTLDEINKDKLVTYSVKVLIAMICGFIVSYLLVELNMITVANCIHNFIISLVSWDYIVKPLLKLVNKKLDYKQKSKLENDK